VTGKRPVSSAIAAATARRGKPVDTCAPPETCCVRSTSSIES
jgi:hypothetical protein